MFGWFQPSCPVDLCDKIWVEQRLAWLVARFGTQRILGAPRILPTREFFPDPYGGVSDDLPELFGRVCEYMGADAKRFDVALFTERDRSDALGLYTCEKGGRPKISLLDSLLPDQEAAIATLSHEVAHDLLLGAGLLTGDEPDHENLTDLLPIVLGMGTFQANTAIKQKSGIEGNMSYWSIRRSGYLTASVCGYAMGVIEWLRHAASPSVAYLGGDAAGALKSGLRYLSKTNDCLIDRGHPSWLTIVADNESPGAIIGGSASRCLYTLQAWLDEGDLSSSQIDVILKCLQREEAVIQSTAIKLLMTVPDPSTEVIDSVLELLLSRNDSIRELATTAAGKFKVPLTHVTPHGDTLFDELLLLSKNPHYETAVAAAVTLGVHGEQSIAAVPRILPLLVRALTNQSPQMEPLFESLSQIVGDLQTYLEQNPLISSEGHRQLICEGLHARKIPFQFGVSRLTRPRN